MATETAQRNYTDDELTDMCYGARAYALSLDRDVCEIAGTKLRGQMLALFAMKYGYITIRLSRMTDADWEQAAAIWDETIAK